MLTEAFLTRATGQTLFCVNVFVCLGKYNIHNIYIQYVVKTILLLGYLFLYKSVSLGNVCTDIVLCISIGITLWKPLGIKLHFKVNNRVLKLTHMVEQYGLCVHTVDSCLSVQD